jgi:hypothetical protein
MMIPWNSPFIEERLPEYLMDSWRDPFSWTSTAAWTAFYYRATQMAMLMPAAMSLAMLQPMLHAEEQRGRADGAAQKD